VLVADMAQKFQTSQVTIRKDLEVLHSHGLIHRTHGGALPAREGALEDPTLLEKKGFGARRSCASQLAPPDWSKRVRS